MDASPQEFRALVERHQARVFSIAYRILGESGVAEEVAQDVFLELHRNLPRLASEEHVTAWLRRVACHRATDALRRRAARGDLAAEEYQDGMALRPVVRDFIPLMNRVEQLLLTLPPQQRAVMLLRLPGRSGAGGHRAGAEDAAGDGEKLSAARGEDVAGQGGPDAEGVQPWLKRWTNSSRSCGSNCRRDRRRVDLRIA